MPAVIGVDVTVPFSLRSADAGRYEYTNYVQGYSGLLDYVFFQPERMCAREALPLPGAAELAGWLPSQRFPSDHLSLVFDLQWLPSEDAPATAAEPTGTAEHAESRSASSAPAELGSDQQRSSQSAGADAAGDSSENGSASAFASADGMLARGDRAEAAARPRGCVMPADESGAAVAAEALRRGDVVAVPTDTLYGLAACANSEQVGACCTLKHPSAASVSCFARALW